MGTSFQKRYGGRWHAGYILVELLIVVVILGSFLVWSAVSYTVWQKEHRLDVAASELAVAIREAQVSAKSGLCVAGMAKTDKVSFVCENGNDGRVRYYMVKNGIIMKPQGVLPVGIWLEGGKGMQINMVFGKNASAVESRWYGVRLISDEGRLHRQITVAMYTGRVRVER